MVLSKEVLLLRKNHSWEVVVPSKTVLSLWKNHFWLWYENQCPVDSLLFLSFSIHPSVLYSLYQYIEFVTYISNLARYTHKYYLFAYEGSVALAEEISESLPIIITIGKLRSCILIPTFYWMSQVDLVLFNSYQLTVSGSPVPVMYQLCIDNCSIRHCILRASCWKVI